MVSNIITTPVTYDMPNELDKQALVAEFTKKVLLYDVNNLADSGRVRACATIAEAHGSSCFPICCGCVHVEIINSLSLHQCLKRVCETATTNLCVS